MLVSVSSVCLSFVILCANYLQRYNIANSYTKQSIKGKKFMSFTVIDRFHPQTRRRLQAAIDAEHLRKLDTLELLVPEQIRTLAWVSLLMLIGGGIFFIGLNVIAYIAQTHLTAGSIGGWPLFLWIGINIVGSIIILPIHEALHGLAITFWGGTPH